MRLTNRYWKSIVNLRQKLLCKETSEVIKSFQWHYAPIYATYSISNWLWRLKPVLRALMLICVILNEHLRFSFNGIPEPISCIQKYKIVKSFPFCFRMMGTVTKLLAFVLMVFLIICYYAKLFLETRKFLPTLKRLSHFLLINVVLITAN